MWCVERRRCVPGRFRGPSGARLLQRRGSLVVRRLATRLGGRAVLSMLSSILEEERDLPFAAALVQALNLILLTAPEVRTVHSHCGNASHFAATLQYLAPYTGAASVDYFMYNGRHPAGREA
jgi:hypothetical protein